MACRIYHREDRMRLLVITTTFPRWPNDTIPAFVYELSLHLKESGFKIVVLTPHSPGAVDYEIIEDICVYRYRYFWPNKLEKLVNGNGILPNLKVSWLAKIQIPLLFIFEIIHTYRVVRKEKITFIHAHWIVPNGLIGAIFSRYCKINTILTEHGAGLVALRKIPFSKWILTFILNNTKEVVAVSEKISYELQHFLKKAEFQNVLPISVIPMGVSTTKYHPHMRHSEMNDNENRIIYILFIGRITEKKGLKYLLEAIPDIVREYSNIKLIVCGKGPDMVRCEQKTCELHINSYVTFKGSVSEQEKIDYLRDAKILVIPSIVTEDGDTEGVPVVLLEGLAAGKTIIASRVGGIPNVIKDGYNGILIPERDHEQLSKNIIRVLRDPGLQSFLSQHALESSEFYDWKCISDQYLKILKVNHDRL